MPTYTVTPAEILTRQVLTVLDLSIALGTVAYVDASAEFASLAEEMEAL